MACAAAAWARPEGPKRIFYGTHSDSRVVVGGRVFRNLPCDDKIHLQRDVRVEQGQKHSVTLGMHSGGTGTVSVWGGP